MKIKLPNWKLPNWKKVAKYRFSKFIALAGVMAVGLILLVIFRPSGGLSTDKLLPGLKEIERPDIAQFGLDMAKIRVWAPIIPDVDGYNQDEYLKKIENGVAQFLGTATPDKEGNLFIFGHSKYYKNKPGNFKEVFRELDVMQPGDQFNIYYQGAKYVYEVTESKLVDKYDWSIMDPTPQNKKDKTATIMTCWPPGTLDARWVIFANQK